MRRFVRWQGWVAGLAVTLVACAAPVTSTQERPAQAPSATDRPKSIVIGISSAVPAFSIVTFGTPTGGWASLTELHSLGLVTSDANSRALVGRLAERIPTLADGGISLLPDGRMRVVFPLRQGVTWHDGAPFTADDLVFSYQIGGPDGIPQYLNGAVPFMAGVEAPDPHTVVITYRTPYFQGTALGPSMFWPLPRHLLGEAYQRFQVSRNPDDVVNLPYWTSGYIHLGPFRLVEFDPASELVFQAYEGYFLGRPRVDTVRVRVFGDQTAFFANLMAGAVDLIPDLALRDATALEIKRLWDANGGGTVYVVEGALRRYDAQRRPGVQREPTILDTRVRAALLHAIDRETLSEAVNGGDPHLAAWSILGRNDPLYDVTRDTLRVYRYDPARARALLQEVGWTFGPDGSPRHSSDGRPFRTSIHVSAGYDSEASAVAAYWRQLGLEVEEHGWTAAETRDNRARALYPGWDGTGGNVVNVLGQVAATAENNWTGSRSGFEDPRAQQLVEAFKGSIDLSDQRQAMQRINEYFLSELPALPLYFIATYIAAAKRVKAFTPGDVAGFMSDSPLIYAYGTLTRNAHLWEVN